MATVAAKFNRERLKAKFLSEKSEKDFKKSSVKTLTNIGLGVIVGGGLGYLIGRPALAVGAIGTFLGHYYDMDWAVPISIGMMATSATSGGEGLRTSSKFDMQSMKDRLTSFKDSLLHRTYLDKVIKSGSSGEGENTDNVSGLGSIAEHQKALQDIEAQLVKSAMDFRRSKGESTAGIEDEMQGIYEGSAVM